jgi:hypothetical protein
MRGREKVFRQRISFLSPHFKKMKKEIKEITKDIVRITTIDERWYFKPSKSSKTGLPEYIYYPSATWILNYYPKSKWFYDWVGRKGLEEAERIKITAGKKGSKVHQAIEKYLKGEKIEMDCKFLNTETEQEEELSVEEYDCLLSFENFDLKYNPEVLANEIVVFNEKEEYAGTIDLICMIGGIIYIIDFKSGNLYPEAELQLSAYSHCDLEELLKEFKISQQDWEARQLAVLQVGYKRNKNGYKLTQLQDKYDLFLNVKNVWANENSEAKPKQKDYPLFIQRKKVVKKTKTK